MNKKEEISGLRIRVESCQRCGLHKTRKNTVIGAGSLDAGIMFIGEAPGFNEDMKGEPFVGRAGTIFDELLKSIDLGRYDVYIANILKCRPPSNRNPQAEEIRACTPYLDEQISIIRPRIIATLGGFSMSYIFGKFRLKEDKISRIHGRVFSISNLSGIRNIVPLYHPAVATYNPGMKGVLMSDFATLRKLSEQYDKPESA